MPSPERPRVLAHLQEHTAAQGLYLSDLRTVCESLELQLRHERTTAQRASEQRPPAPDPVVAEVGLLATERSSLTPS